MTIGRLLPIVVVVLAGACAKNGFGRFDALPKAAQDPFTHCTDGLHGHPAYSTKARQCDSYGALDDRFQPCWEKMRGEYADLADDAARRKWLTDDGCPPAEVDAK